MAAGAREMISLAEACELVLSCVGPLEVERVPVLAAMGRVAAEDLRSDMDIAPFAHAAMDGFAVRADDLAAASAEAPVTLSVIAEAGAGDVFDGCVEAGQCVRIMTGAQLANGADAVVKYEIVDVVTGDGKPGSTVSFSAPAPAGANIRAAGEEARAGETVVCAGETLRSAGAGFLASCGVLEVPTYRRPRVALMATGSELVNASQVPGPGKIRDSNSYAMAACALAAGAEPVMLPAVPDTYDDLVAAVRTACAEYDFVVTTGGAANGDFDFIKQVVADAGELLMTSVNMRPGKAQTFGIVDGTPVFGLPGNPAAAYCGFELIVRPALRKMQGFTSLQRPRVMAALSQDVRKRDPRCIFLRAVLTRAEDGTLAVVPAKNQSSGLFGVIQKSNCLAVMPEGLESRNAGDMVECILLDVDEGTIV